jgi:Ca-activated chloride channel homolog
MSLLHKYCFDFSFVGQGFSLAKKYCNSKGLPCVICLIIFLSVSQVFALSATRINKANKLAKHNKFDEALKIYRDEQVKNNMDTILNFDLGNALYKKGDYKDALDSYEKSTYTKDINIQAKAYYNMGNAFYKSGDLESAINYYKKCLDINPKHENAKYNIEFLQRKIKENMKNGSSKENQQKQQQQQNQGQNKEGQKGQDKNKEQQKSQAQQKQQEKDKKNEEQKKEQEENKQEQKKQGMSKEDAQRLLEAFSDQDKKPKNEKQYENQGVGHKSQDW